MGELLKGKVAIVTGSGQGIGRGIALGLAAEGAAVVTNNRQPGSTGFALLNETHIQALNQEQRKWLYQLQKDYNGDAETTAAAIRLKGGRAAAFFGDITDFATAGKLVQMALDTFGKIDILVNVAGTFRFKPLEEAAEEDWNHVFNVKPRAYFNTIRHAAPHMLKQKWGRILNCTSQAWAGDSLPHVHYAAANAAVIGLTRAVSNEFFNRGVTCNAFSPWARTRASFELTAYFLATRPANPEGERMQKAMFENTPAPESLGPFMAYMSSDLSSKISGSVFNIGGNRIGIYPDPVVKSTVTKPGGDWSIEELKEQLPATVLANYHSISENIRKM